MKQYSDSIDMNLSILEQLMSEVPHQHRNKVRAAANAIEDVVKRLRTDHPKDPFIALGFAWAAHKLAQNLTAAPHHGDPEKPLIQLLP